jgi:hypothetical protein
VQAVASEVRYFLFNELDWSSRLAIDAMLGGRAAEELHFSPGYPR